MPLPQDVPMPPDLDLGSEYTLRVTAIDTSVGNLMPGATIGTVVITADQATADTGGTTSLEYGDWMLVPGPGA